MTKPKHLAKTKPKHKAPGPVEQPRIKCMFNLPVDTAQKIREQAAQRGLSMSAFVTLMVDGRP